MEAVESQAEQLGSNTRLELLEVVALGITWAAAFGSIWLLVSNYRGEQTISLENAIAYIMIGVTLVSFGILFRGAITRRIDQGGD